MKADLHNNAVCWLAMSRLVFSRLQVKVIRKLHLRLKVAILFGSNIVWSDKKVSAAFDCLFPELRIIQIETTRNGFCKNLWLQKAKTRLQYTIYKKKVLLTVFHDHMQEDLSKTKDEAIDWDYLGKGASRLESTEICLKQSDSFSSWSFDFSNGVLCVKFCGCAKQ